MPLPEARVGEESRGFALGLALIVIVGVAARLVYAIAIAPTTAGINDTFWYRTVSAELAADHGFVVPVGSQLRLQPTALHPPLYPLVLAAAQKLGISGDSGLRSLGALFGALTIIGTGLLGRAIAGARLGLVAAALAACYPLLIEADGTLLSETLYGPLVVLVLFTAWRLCERPGAGRAALLGLAIGLAALTRSESLLLLPLLALPLAWRGGGAGRVWRLAAATAATVLVLAPWVARNWSVFDRPLLSTNEGTTVAWTNCGLTYHGRDLGYKTVVCAPRAPAGNEAERAAALRRRGSEYARDHASRWPLVVSVRLLRTAGLYQPFRLDDAPGRSKVTHRLGVVYFYVLALLAIAGGVVLRSRRRLLLILGVPILIVCLTTALTYGAVRPRFLAEVPLVMLAAAGLVAWPLKRGADSSGANQTR
jgi:4-amino-4-deoxy-L-arabinose transferase-like glycosyltransferase